MPRATTSHRDKRRYVVGGEHPFKAARRERAEIRQQEYDALSTTEKISIAEARGGSKKELARLREKEEVDE